MLKTLIIIAALIAVSQTTRCSADQFVLFDVTFTFTKTDADNSTPSKSHYYVKGDKLNPARPRDWTAPVDYRNGTIHIRTEVLEKPAGNEPTTWTICYIPNRGQGNGYGCTGTEVYREKGVYERDVPMTAFWENDAIVWAEGIKQMDLVMKDGSGGSGHVHKRADADKFFPTKMRITVTQVSAGAKYDPKLPPTANAGDRAGEPANDRKVDLQKEARIFVSHATPGDEFRIENAIDRDPETKWVGEAHPLSFQPANIVIEFSQPEVVERVVLLSTIFRDRLALKDVELYARAAGGWAGDRPLAKAQATNVLTSIPFAPTKTSGLRIRVRDTWREDHSYPRIHEIEVYRAAPGTDGRILTAGLISDEKGSERAVMRRTLGEKYVAPGTVFDPAKGYRYYVTEFIETMMRDGTDRYGKVSSPMFASILDMQTHRLPEDIPANIEGQRYGDRSLRGGNLHHDVMLLQACDWLSQLAQDPKYTRAKREYLEFFIKNCPQPTGLFPWGEHAYWDFHEEKPGAAIHEFLGGIPNAFWESLWQIDTRAVQREADGLLNHFTDLETFHFDRHADLFKSAPDPRPRGGGGMDFPRHAGFYLKVWGFLYAKTHESKYAEWMLKMIDHHWRARGTDGILPSTTKGSQAQMASAESTLSLGVSLLETAGMLSNGDLKERCLAAGEAYVRAVVSWSHQPAEGKFLSSLQAKPGGDRTPDYSEPYRYGYGGGFTADNASLLLAAYRLTKDAPALALAESFAGFYTRNEPPPAYEIVRAHVFASIIGLFTDLYTVTGKRSYLEQAERYAKVAIERLFHGGLFRGATGVDHYESDLMPGNLAYNLLWLEAAKNNSPKMPEPNYFNR